ncbi:MAG: zinc-dependent alcohol dehydrogenase, partial [Acidobacteriota bacterium]
MKALLYRRSVPRYLASMLASKLAPRRFFPFLAPLALENVPFDPPKGWLPLRPRLCGICGSDLGLLRGLESPLLEPYASLPFILGHEMVAELAEDAPNLGLAAGTRVVVEPGLPCEVRGLPPCRSCREGRYNRCERFLDGDLPAGSFLGFTRRAGGAMAERTAAHPSRLLAVPQGLRDEDAVLTDSLASALQPVLDHFPADEATVLVIGAGIVGQMVVRALRGCGSASRVLVAARHPLQAQLALAGGADAIMAARTRRELAQAVGGRYLPTSRGGGNIEGGVDLVFDCVG